jgi:hypothetical protein
MSQADRPKPYQPRGVVDGIVCDTTLAKKMTLRARWGTSCGTPFEAKPFFQQHIQWREQEPYMKDRPYQPWTDFSLLQIISKANINKANININKSKNKTRVKEEKIKQIKSNLKKRTQKRSLSKSV